MKLSEHALRRGLGTASGQHPLLTLSRGLELDARACGVDLRRERRCRRTKVRSFSVILTSTALSRTGSRVEAGVLVLGPGREARCVASCDQRCWDAGTAWCVAWRARVAALVGASTHGILEGGAPARAPGVGLGLELALVDVPVADIDGEDAEAQTARETAGATVMATAPRCSRAMRRRSLMARAALHAHLGGAVKLRHAREGAVDVREERDQLQVGGGGHLDRPPDHARPAPGRRAGRLVGRTGDRSRSWSATCLRCRSSALVPGKFPTAAKRAPSAAIWLRSLYALNTRANPAMRNTNAISSGSTSANSTAAWPLFVAKVGM